MDCIKIDHKSVSIYENVSIIRCVLMNSPFAGLHMYIHRCRCRRWPLWADSLVSLSLPLMGNLLNITFLFNQNINDISFAHTQKQSARYILNLWIEGFFVRAARESYWVRLLWGVVVSYTQQRCMCVKKLPTASWLIVKTQFSVWFSRF